MPLLSRAMRAASNGAWILRKGNRLGRWRTLATYARIECKRLLFPARRRERIFGSDIQFADYGSFAALFEEIFVSQAYCVELSDPEPRIFDCGANIGMSVLYFLLLYPDARIDAFEPERGSFELLAVNKLRNGWANVHIHNAAVHREEGTLPLYVYRPGSLVSAVTDWVEVPARVEEVKTVRLASFIDGPVDILKLDIEGSEQAVLEDLVDSGKIAQVRNIVAEYHHHMDASEDNLGRFLALLEASGFGYDFHAPATRPFQARLEHFFLLFAYRKAA